MTYFENYVNLKLISQNKGWTRRKSLDRLCEEQRYLRLYNQNSNFKGRKLSIVSAYRLYLSRGICRKKAYEMAVENQLAGIDLTNVKKINIDSWNAWEFAE